MRKTVDVDENNDIVYPEGYVHLPNVDAEFLQQLCAEQLVTRNNKNGFPVREWQKRRERNEALDCYVHARAAAGASGLDRFEERHWRELENQLAPPTKSQSTPTPAPTRRVVIKPLDEPLMPWTQDDRNALERALAKGEQRVTFGDKTVVYRSVDELRAALNEVNRQLAQTEGNKITRQIRVISDKGF